MEVGNWLSLSRESLIHCQINILERKCREQKFRVAVSRLIIAFNFALDIASRKVQEGGDGLEFNHVPLLRADGNCYPENGDKY